MKKYVLKWQDEFDYIGPINPEKWAYDSGARRWGNGEVQYYTEGKNSFVKDSILTIEGRIENYEDCPYTSARITTFGKQHFMYGRLEINAKIPKAMGAWPAIWMLPADRKELHVPWPKCGEIDIMEHVHNHFETVHVSLHTALYNHVKRTQRTHFELLEGVTDDFHEFAMDWGKDYIEFFIDKKSFKLFQRNEEGFVTNDDGWPFDKPYYLILNLAIGGNWGGTVAPEDFPSQFLIDYVRYYEIVEE